MPGPHDALFRATFEKHENAVAELKRVLPPELVSAIDFSTLKVLPGHFVDEELAECESDLLLSVELGGAAALIYVLVEHQSTVKWAMPIRLLRLLLQRTRGNPTCPASLARGLPSQPSLMVTH